MRKTFVFIVILTLLVVSAQAQVLLQEDWETGMDGWVPVGTLPAAELTTEGNTTPGGQWCLKTVPTSVSGANAVDWFFASETGKVWSVSWNFNDTGTTREYLQVYSYAQDGSLQNLYALGAYHSVTNGMSYFASRIAVGSTNWVTTTALRSTGWHSMKMEQDTGGTVTFWIDNVIADQRVTTAVYGGTKIRCGSALSNAGLGAYYDDIIFTQVVPEPGSLFALAAGIVGMAGMRRRA